MLEREAFFLDTPSGGRFCLLTRPPGKPRGAIFFIPPFAEEMNKSRRMVTLAAQAFARDGWLVLQIDLFGCGDSAGDFSEATWDDWLGDIDLGWTWLIRECERIDANGPQVLWTLRAGSLLAADWISRRKVCPSLLMWQAVASGKQHLTQFLRLKAANEMLVEADARAAMVAVRAELQSGNIVEVAGYGLSARLAEGLSAATLAIPPCVDADRVLLEVGGGDHPEPSPLAIGLAKKWSAEGVAVVAEAIPGPAFWQTLEIEVAPMLIERSLFHLERLCRECA